MKRVVRRKLVVLAVAFALVLSMIPNVYAANGVLKVNLGGAAMGVLDYGEATDTLDYDPATPTTSIAISEPGTYKLGAKPSDGSTFVGWRTGDGKLYSKEAEITVTLGDQNIDLFAMFRPKPTQTRTLTLQNGAPFDSYSEDDSVGVPYVLLMAGELVKEDGKGEFKDFAFYKDKNGKSLFMYSDEARRFAYDEDYHDITYKITDEVRDAMEEDLVKNRDLYDESYQAILLHMISDIDTVELKFAKLSTLQIKIGGSGMGNVTYAYAGEKLSYTRDDLAQHVLTSYVGEYKIAAVPDKGNKFVKWTKDGKDYSTEKVVTVTLEDKDIDMVAVFEAEAPVVPEPDESGQEKSPATGDASDIALYAGIMAAALAAIAFSRRRRQEK